MLSWFQAQDSLSVPRRKPVTGGSHDSGAFHWPVAPSCHAQSGRFELFGFLLSDALPLETAGNVPYGPGLSCLLLTTAGSSDAGLTRVPPQLQSCAESPPVDGEPSRGSLCCVEPSRERLLLPFPAAFRVALSSWLGCPSVSPSRRPETLTPCSIPGALLQVPELRPGQRTPGSFDSFGVKLCSH